MSIIDQDKNKAWQIPVKLTWGELLLLKMILGQYASTENKLLEKVNQKFDELDKHIKNAENSDGA
jgi:hypothetical protein